jgi:hypothetical protein
MRRDSVAKAWRLRRDESRRDGMLSAHRWWEEPRRRDRSQVEAQRHRLRRMKESSDWRRGRGQRPASLSGALGPGKVLGRMCW